MTFRTSVTLLLALGVTCASAQDHSKPLKVLEWRSELIRSLAFTSDGKQLVVSPKDNDCWVFGADTGTTSEVDLKGARGPTNFLLARPRSKQQTTDREQKVAER